MFSARSWFRRHQTPLLGVDISPAGIRVIELAREGKGFRVAHYAREPLPPGALRDGSFAEMEVISEALRRALKASGTRLRTIAMALPSGAVIKKMLMLPASLYEEELEMQVESEASQILPFPLDEISLDFATLGPSTSEEGYADVMLVATRKERIDERVSLAEMAGLRALAMDVESQAMTNALTLLPSERERSLEQPVVLLHLCSDSGHCYVLLNGRVIYERELGLTLPRLEQDRSSGATQPLREALCQELMRALQLFATSTQHGGVAHVYIAGSSHLLSTDLALFVQSSVGIQTSLPYPFPAASLSSAASDMPHDDAPACLVAGGLALKSFVT